MKPGDKVVCVDDAVTHSVAILSEYHAPAWPKKGLVYVVDSTPSHGDLEIGPRGVSVIQGDCVRIIGLPVTHIPSGAAGGWAARRFRLLSELRAEAAANAKTLQPA